ncbi:MAG TPA: transglycosylase domain-containing protein [Acidimicrobiales bacterium]|nr:transglycosylase domain-containing protein [Acidimicrobiales bacterium]
MLAVLAGVGVTMARTELPELTRLNQASYVCASDVGDGQCTADNAMTRLQSDDGNRTNVDLEDVPTVVVQAVLSVEDRAFYQHDGVNPEGIVRAMFQNVRSGSVQQGGSTITQQYVLNSFKLSRDGGLSRKVREAALSIKLEQQMSKDEILEGYLNTIYFGRGAYGIAAASRAYFGIDVSEITDPGQAALLAGLIRAPNLAEPSTNPKEATRRRHTGLVAMREEGYITDDQLAVADAVPVAEPWVKPVSAVRLTDTLRGAAPDDYMATDYLAPYIESELKRIDPERFTEEAIRGGGLRIYTSVNYDMQRAGVQALRTTLDREDDPNTPEWEGDPEAALVAVDDQGLVRAMVGSRHPFTPRVHETNYAVRSPGSQGFQPGSTFKPIVLAQALREGYSLRSRYEARGTMTFPEWTDEDEQPVPVSNYSESDEGVMDLVEATAQSSNTAYAQLMLDLGVDRVDPDGDGQTVYSGPETVAELAESMGIGGSEGIPQAQRTPALVLGTVSATPLEMAGAYSTFMNRGVYKHPDIVTRVEQVSDDGVTVLYQRQVRQTPLLSELQADLVTHALQAVMAKGGTGEGAAIGRPAAGKTGTAQDNRASWFAGYVPGLTATVWMGYPKADYTDPETGQVGLWPMNEKGRPVHGRAATGGSFPAEMWRKFMGVAAAKLPGSFVEVSEEQIEGGEVLNGDELQVPSETVPPTSIDVGAGGSAPSRPGSPLRPGPRSPRATVPDEADEPTQPDATDAEPTTTTTDRLAGPPTSPLIPGGGLG